MMKAQRYVLYRSVPVKFNSPPPGMALAESVDTDDNDAKLDAATGERAAKRLKVAE